MTAAELLTFAFTFSYFQFVLKFSMAVSELYKTSLPNPLSKATDNGRY